MFRKENVTQKLGNSALDALGTRVAFTVPLMDAGLDSLAGTSLVKSISDSFSTELSATLMFDYPTLDAIQSFLWSSCEFTETPIAEVDQLAN